MTMRTITLTGRPPVRIEDDNWDVIAQASDKAYDGQFESQANRVSQWWIKVRQHEDGRALVYAGYSYTSNWQGARDYHAKHGTLLPAGTTAEQICEEIEHVCRLMADAECDGDDAARWPTLAAECIADMPAETID